MKRTPDDRIFWASNEYRERLENAKNQMAQIGDLLQSKTVKQERDPLNWGHAGDMGHVNELLGGIVDFLNLDAK